MPQLTVAIFHVFADGPDYFRDMISMAARSVKRVYPDANVVLLTNLRRDDLGLPSYVAVSPVNQDLESLMLERIRHYLRYVSSCAADGYLILMDSDMLLLRSIDEQLRDDFDIGLTLRNMRKAPINGGLYIVNLAHRSRGILFFERLLDVYHSLPIEHRRWDGDQIALAKMLNPPPAHPKKTLHAAFEGARIKYLPVSIYNNTPRRFWLNRILLNPFAKIIHLKGERKNKMPRYFERYVEGRMAEAIRGLSAVLNRA